MHYKEDGITVCDCLDSLPPITTAQLEEKNRWKTQKFAGYPRRAKVVELRKLNPEWTLQNIADEVEVSRERVRGILKSENLETRRIKIRPPAPLCMKCKTPVPFITTSLHGGHYNKYCSIECRSEEIIELTCVYCNSLYVLTTAQAKGRQKRVTNGYSKATYCSHSCSSKAYWDVALGRTPNTLSFNLKFGPRGKKWEKAK